MYSDESADIFPSKHPSANLDYAVNFEQECARKWDRWTDFATNARIRVYVVGSESGYEFEATTGGRTAGKPPRWPIAINSAVNDGSVVWTARALSSSSISRTISGTPTWSADSGVTISGVAVNGMVSSAKIASGTDGNDYSVTISATLSDGVVIAKTVVLPVRLPVRVCE